MVVFRLPTNLSFNAYLFEVGEGAGMSKNGTAGAVYSARLYMQIYVKLLL